MTGVPPLRLALPPLSLYVHTPWCVRKCPYCDFNSHARTADLPESAYLDALREDLQDDLRWVQARPIRTLFIGGGTPSLLSPDFYARLFEVLQAQLTFADDIEITLEANPGTVELGRFRGYRQAGINRLSLGIQSFNDKALQALGRIHDSQSACRAIDATRDAGFTRFNLDLMHGLPGQDVNAALTDLRQALAFEPRHLSWYQLTLEPNTEFYRRPPPLPDDDLLWAISDAGAEHLTQSGFTGYEISAWSLPGEEARHNLNYWEFGDYLALGAGAHGKVTLPDEDRILRYWKTRQPDAYLRRIGSRTAGQQDIPTDERALEYLMNVLRLRRGVAEAAFTPHTGLPLTDIADILAGLRAQGLMDPERLQASAEGFRHLNGLLERFL